MPVHLEAWRAYLRFLNFPLEDLPGRMHGRRNDEIVRELLGTGPTADEIFNHGAAKERLFRDLMQPQLERQLVPGVVEFIVRCAGTPMGVASNAEPANVDFVLDGAGLRSHFQAVINGHQVQRPKPFPDIYIKAAELLGMAPKKCVVFEDSPAGVEAALSSGAKVVGVLTHPTELRGVDLLIQDFLDEQLPVWLSKLPASPV